MKEELLKVLENFPGKKIAVIGDIILDQYIFGEVDRISPEAPVPVVKVSDEKYVPGGAANVASNLVSLGAETYLLGLTGEDEDRDILLGSAEILGIDTSGILTSAKRNTIKKTRVIGMNQQLLRIDFEDNEYIESDLEESLIKKLTAFTNLDAVIISDYAKGVITEELVNQVKAWCRDNMILLVVDPKPKNMGWYKNVDLITPNKSEAQLMSGIQIETEEDYLKVVKVLEQKLGANLVLTAGAQGMYVSEVKGQGLGDRRLGPEDRRLETGDRRLEIGDRRQGPEDRRQETSTSGEVKHISTVAREVYDVSGAGDTVVAVLALALVSGADLYSAAEIANHAAGIKVGKLGTSAVTREELERDLNKG